MEKIKSNGGTLYLPPAMTGQKLKRFLDMNGFVLSSPKVMRLKHDHSNKIRRAICKNEIDEYFETTRNENELPYKIID